MPDRKNVRDKKCMAARESSSEIIRDFNVSYFHHVELSFSNTESRVNCLQSREQASEGLKVAHLLDIFSASHYCYS